MKIETIVGKQAGRKPIRMKGLLVAFAVFVSVGVGLSLARRLRSMQTFEEVLESCVDNAPWTTYRDEFYGYALSYPSFFEREPQTASGCVRFSYWNVERLVMESIVEIDLAQTPVARKMREVAEARKADCCRVVDQDSFVVAGVLPEAEGLGRGYRYYTKFVRNHKVWLSCSLYYPQRCESALGSLFGMLDVWKDWPEHKA